MIVIVSPAIYALWIAFLLNAVIILFAIFYMPETLYAWRNAEPKKRDRFALISVVVFAVVLPFVACAATAWLAVNLF